MESCPRVAIIIPVFNTEKYLKDCLDSIINQDYKSLVVYAIDDGSTDNSLNILNSYSEKNPIINVLHQKNSGVSSARNLALDKITEDESIKYISFVDSDDLISRDFISTFTQELEARNADYGVCGVISFDKSHHSSSYTKHRETEDLHNSEIIEQYLSIDKWENQGATSEIFISNKFFSVHAIKNIRFNTNLTVGEDVDFLIRLLQKIKKGVYIPKCNYFYRLRASSLSKANISPIENMLRSEEMLKTSSDNKYLRKYLEKLLLDCWWGTIKHAYTNNNNYEKKICNQKFNQIRTITANFHSSKYSRRLFLYNLGDKLLSLYFRIRSNKNDKNKLNYFE